jgi:hypothetical protein
MATRSQIMDLVSYSRISVLQASSLTVMNNQGLVLMSIVMASLMLAFRGYLRPMLKSKKNSHSIMDRFKRTCAF